MNKLNDKVEQHGYWELYDRSDNLYAKGEYINGLKNGYWEWYDHNGNIGEKEFFL